MKIIRCNVDEYAEIVEIDGSYDSIKTIVDGYIETLYFNDEPVCIVCDEEGKLTGKSLNRGVYDNGKLIDIIAGDFIIAGVGDEDFISLTDEQAEKYCEMFKYPEHFIKINGEIIGIKKVKAVE